MKLYKFSWSTKYAAGYTFVVEDSEEHALTMARSRHYPDTHLELEDQTEIDGPLVFSVTTDQNVY